MDSILLYCRMYFRQDKGVTVHAEHGLMYEDARQHQRAAYYYKLAIMVGSQTVTSQLDYNVDSVLVGIAEAYDGEWQDTGACPALSLASLCVLYSVSYCHCSCLSVLHGEHHWHCAMSCLLLNASVMLSTGPCFVVQTC